MGRRSDPIGPRSVVDRGPFVLTLDDDPLDTEPLLAQSDWVDCLGAPWQTIQLVGPRPALVAINAVSRSGDGLALEPAQPTIAGAA